MTKKNIYIYTYVCGSIRKFVHLETVYLQQQKGEKSLKPIHI